MSWRLSAATTEEVAFYHTGGVVLALYPRAMLAADAKISPEGSGFGRFGLAHNVAT